MHHVSLFKNKVYQKRAMSRSKHAQPVTDPFLSKATIRYH